MLTLLNLVDLMVKPLLFHASRRKPFNSIDDTSTDVVKIARKHIQSVFVLLWNVYRNTMDSYRELLLTVLLLVFAQNHGHKINKGKTCIT